MMNEEVKYLIEKLQELNPEAVLIDGFNNALIGYSNEFKAVYDWDLIILELINQGMTRIEAIEYYDFNISRALKNNNFYPIILHTE